MYVCKCTVRSCIITTYVYTVDKYCTYVMCMRDPFALVCVCVCVCMGVCTYVCVSASRTYSHHSLLLCTASYEAVCCKLPSRRHVQHGE